MTLMKTRQRLITHSLPRLYVAARIEHLHLTKKKACLFCAFCHSRAWRTCQKYDISVGQPAPDLHDCPLWREAEMLVGRSTKEDTYFDNLWVHTQRPVLLAVASLAFFGFFRSGETCSDSSDIAVDSTYTCMSSFTICPFVYIYQCSHMNYLVTHSISSGWYTSDKTMFCHSCGGRAVHNWHRPYQVLVLELAQQQQRASQIILSRCWVNGHLMLIPSIYRQHHSLQTCKIKLLILM